MEKELNENNSGSISHGNVANISETINFGGMKGLLAELDLDCDDRDLPFEIKRRSHLLCARFLGGAWKSLPTEHMHLNRIKGGMSNILFLCRLPEHHRPLKTEPDKVLLRAYFNPETDSHLVAESVVFTLLSERHLGPKLYGIFSGGRLEEYIPSRPLSCLEIGLPIMAKKIAKRLARVHQLEVPIWKEPDYLCDALERWLQQLSVMPSGCQLFDIEIPDWLSASSIPSSVTCQDLFDELTLLKRCIGRSSSPVVFCHNDLQEGNILLPKASSGNIRMPSVTEETANQQWTLSAFNPAAPRLVLIDFEYASYNYRAFDFANHFAEYSIDYAEPDPPFYRLRPQQFPSAVQQREFFDSYLSEVDVMTGQTESNHGSRLEEMVEETKPFVAVSHMLWGVWALLQVELSPLGFGFAQYGRERLALYYASKPDLISLDS